VYEFTAHELEEPQHRVSAPTLFPRGEELEEEHGKITYHPQYSDHKEQEVEQFVARDYEADYHNQRRKKLGFSHFIGDDSLRKDKNYKSVISKRGKPSRSGNKSKRSISN
jgi:hypothetical protein